MDDRYLLTTDLSQQLFEQVRALPLIDYHNHLVIDDVAQNRRFENIAALWLNGDPYKHRAMRICGVPERLITGIAKDEEKFNAWCDIFPRLVGNPLYDWSRMEMEWLFGIKLPINHANAGAIWQAANERLEEPKFHACGLLEHFNVEYAAPCAAIGDDLKPFQAMDYIAPSLRGDDLLAPSVALIHGLEVKTSRTINCFADFAQSVGERLNMFHAAGCRFGDHALDNGFVYLPEDGGCEARFMSLLTGAQLSVQEQRSFASDMLRFLGGEYTRLGWVMQLHIGAQRATSQRLRTVAGAAGGYAGIGHCVDVRSLTSLLDDLERRDMLPRTLLFTLNPADNAVLSALSGSFSQDGVAAKVSQGPAWWWCDHLQGMREVFDSMSAYSVLSTFVGMTTDSRSLLSMLRHDYFRRALCGWVGEKARRGELPPEPELLGWLVKALCYENARRILKGEFHE